MAPAREWLPLGSDAYGHDLLEVLARGAIASSLIATTVATAAVALGTAMALLTSYSMRVRSGPFTPVTPSEELEAARGGWVRDWAPGLEDLVMALPAFVFVMALSQHLQQRRDSLVLILTSLSWPATSRWLRTECARLQQEAALQSAIAVGASPYRLLIHHILPRLRNPIIVSWCLVASETLLAEAALSYLGFGSGEGQPSLGRLLAQGTAGGVMVPQLIVFPAMVLTFLVLALRASATELESQPEARSRDRRLD